MSIGASSSQGNQTGGEARTFQYSPDYQAAQEAYIREMYGPEEVARLRAAGEGPYGIQTPTGSSGSRQPRFRNWG